MKTVIHVTHEAVQKIGGIGAVLHGLITSRAYRAEVCRDILLGPLFSTEGPAEGRLHGGKVLYSGLDGIRNTPHANDFSRIEHTYGVKIVYGTKVFHDALSGVSFEPEVVLIDVRYTDMAKMDALKFLWFERFGIESSRYEHIWDYEQYCRIAEPGLEAVHAIGGCSDGTLPIVLAHEYMGMPTALCAMAQFPGQFRTIFYAHEVATMRRLVEAHPGHDLMFHNVLEKAVAEGKYVEDVFGSQADFYKHPLVEASRFCDGIFAVGDDIIKELRFLRKEFKDLRIDLAYNGVPAGRQTAEEKQHSRRKLKAYCFALLGIQPDYLLTHVTRLVPSKGLWRDIEVVAQLENHLARENQSAVLFVVATETAGRAPAEILAMESAYHWPAAHREGHADLTGGEAHYYTAVQEWNARSRFCKIVYINQFVVDAASLGARAPADLEFLDFRKGSDAEFGQSTYEPFGIAQVEPISFGGICVYTTLCGCAGFVKHAAGGQPVPNALPVDYTRLPESMQKLTIAQLLQIGKSTRDELEHSTAVGIAEELFTRLPRTPAEFETLIAEGQKLGAGMSWDTVAAQYVLPGMDYALQGHGRAAK